MFWVFLCSLSYPAWKAHAPYYIVFVACPAVPDFSALSHKRHHIQKKKTFGHKTCVLIFVRFLPVTFPILRIIQRDLIVNVHGSSRKVSLILARFKWKLHFLDRFSKNTRVSNFTKICPFDTWVFLENMSRKWNFHLNGKNKGYFTWRPTYIYDEISLNYFILVAFRNFGKSE